MSEAEATKCCGFDEIRNQARLGIVTAQKVSHDRVFVHVRTACFFEIMEHGWFRVDQDPKVAGGQVHLGVHPGRVPRGSGESD